MLVITTGFAFVDISSVIVFIATLFRHCLFVEFPLLIHLSSLSLYFGFIPPRHLWFVIRSLVCHSTYHCDYILICWFLQFLLSKEFFIELLVCMKFQKLAKKHLPSKTKQKKKCTVEKIKKNHLAAHQGNFSQNLLVTFSSFSQNG